jgi:sigma-B regulation protein RsbU (phosphoserine phosphatase)
VEKDLRILHLENVVRTLNSELEQAEIANDLKDALRSRDIEVGLRIQQSLLLSRPPVVPGLEIAALTVPSESIDGDFYIFLRYPNRSVDVIVGDVMGKGIPAALLGAATKSEFLKAISYLLAVSRDGAPPEPGDIVTLAHANIVRQLLDLETFVTLCFVRLDLVRRIFTLVDCGHTGMIHWHASTGRCKVMHGDSLPLGICDGEIFDCISGPFELHDVLFLYSDGITEARNSDGELFGVERLTAHLAAHAELEPSLLADSIRRTVSAFAAPSLLSDDLTSVAIRIAEEPLAEGREEMEILSDLLELRKVRHFVRQFCATLHDPVPDGDLIDALELAADEAASNIMRHAYHGRADQRIHLEAEAYADKITLLLRHMGSGFEPPHEPPMPQGDRESGLGTYIIFNCVDQASYYRDERGRNCVSLVINRRQPDRIDGKEVNSDGTVH